MSKNNKDHPPATLPLSGTEVIHAVDDADADVSITPANIIAAALNRANHTGTQAQSTITGLVSDLAAKALDSAVVKLTGGQIISGIKTFLSAPVVPNGSWTIAKTVGLQTALDALPSDSSVVKLTGAQTVAGVKTFSDAPVVPDGSWTIADTYTLQAALDAKAVDVDVVKLTGDQAVAGNKTFAAAPQVPDASFAIAKTSGLQTALDAKDPIVLTVNTVAASGATETIPDVTTAQVSHITLTADCTFTFPTAAAGKRFTLVLVQDGATPRLATWPASAKWPGATAPTLSTGAGKVDQFRFLCSDGATWAGTVDGLDIR